MYFITNKFDLKLSKKYVLLLLVCLFSGINLWAQGDTAKIYQGIELSGVVVRDMRNGFDVGKFVQMVNADTTFYKAFKSTKLVSFTMYNNIEFFSKKNKIISKYSSISKQVKKDNCREMLIENEKVTGPFYTRKKTYRYYTADLYDKLFFIHSKRCNENDIVNQRISMDENKRINQLKELIFKPGQSINGIPGVGSKMGIFEPKQKKHYHFSLAKKELNGVWCYVFKARPKDYYKNRAVIDRLETWFRVSDNAILSRKYALSYNTLLYDFNVEMNVKLKPFSHKLIPYEIKYKGNWHFVGKQRERASFTAILTDIEE